MKKAFGIFLLTVLLSAVICAGCGEGNPDAPAASGGKKEAGDSVIVGGRYPVSHQPGSGAELGQLVYVPLGNHRDSVHAG